MYHRYTSTRTDYEQSRPAPSAVASLAVAALLPVAMIAVLAAPVATTATVLAVPVVLRALPAVRRRSTRRLARAAALRVEPLLPAALQR